MNILALDLGTHTGIAYNKGSVFNCGTWQLASPAELKAERKNRMDRRLDIRVCRFYDKLDLLLDTAFIDAIVFEDVLFQSSRMQTQLWASFRTAVWLAARVKGIIPECVPTGTLKKFAGHGAATKDMMAKFLARQDPDFYFDEAAGRILFQNRLITDDAVDAVWLWKWAKQNICKGI